MAVTCLVMEAVVMAVTCLVTEAVVMAVKVSRKLSVVVSDSKLMVTFRNMNI